MIAGISDDVKLLALCSRLTEMQAEWQRLYDATSDEDRLVTSADHAWNDYSNNVWPGIRIASGVFHQQPHPDDLPGRLLQIKATTPEGQAAKASAILAMDKAAAYCDLRDDACELMMSLLRDVAGIRVPGLGEDVAAPATPPVPPLTPPPAPARPSILDDPDEPRYEFKLPSVKGILKANPLKVLDDCGAPSQIPETTPEPFPRPFKQELDEDIDQPRFAFRLATKRNLPKFDPET